MTVRAKKRYRLLKELEQFKHSSSTKNAAANEVTKTQEAVSNVAITEKTEKQIKQIKGS